MSMGTQQASEKRSHAKTRIRHLFPAKHGFLAVMGIGHQSRASLVTDKAGAAPLEGPDSLTLPAGTGGGAAGPPRAAPAGSDRSNGSRLTVASGATFPNFPALFGLLSIRA